IRARPRASCSSVTRVPVASWVRVWSMRSPSSLPGASSPDSRCDLMSLWARFSAIVSLLRLGSGRSVDDSGRSTAPAHATPGPRGSQDPSSLVRRATGGHNGLMPDLPEVDSLVEFLRPRLTGDFVTRADIAELSLLKT